MPQPESRSNRLDLLLSAGIILACVAVALAIRIVWPYETVFVDGNVWFREMDSWYRMRLVDSLIHNFPFTTEFDPYSFFPHGIRVTFHPLTSWLIAVPALILGGGSPSPALIDACGAYLPPFLGALTVIPVYFIGRHLYGRVAGAAGALFIAVMPGEFLSRSLLGFTDHHVTEAFFSTLALLLLMRALREADNAQVVLRHASDLRKPAYRRTIARAVLAGVSLGLYLLAWRGGVLVLAILVVYSIIRSLSDYRRDRTGDDLVLVFAIAGAVAMILAAPTIGPHYMSLLYVAAMLSVILVPVALRLFASLGRRLGWSWRAFSSALVGVLGLAFAVMLLVSPVLAGYVRGALEFMMPTGTGLTIMEMHPLFFPGGEFSVVIAWNNFVTLLAGSLVALALLVRSSRRPRGNDVLLFVIWSVVMLCATLLQRRFGYYYAVNAAILTGFLIGWVFSQASMRRLWETLHQRTVVSGKAMSKHAARALQQQRSEKRTAAAVLAIVALLLAGFFVVPSIDMARNFAVEPGLMTAGWYEAATWMRDNTPEPLDPEAYYTLHDAPDAGQPYVYPESAYGVMAWWDYGHWITRLAHRIPVSNPFQQGARSAARLFLSQSEADGIAVMEDMGCDYVMVDSKTSVRTFHGVAAFNGQERSEYIDVFLQRNTTGEWEPVVLYYPEYYQTMLVRLYNFGGAAYEPEEYTAIRHDDGQTAKQIVDVRRFEEYDEALAFLQQASDGGWRMVSSNPLVSAVPLEALESFSVVYESTAESFLEAQMLPEVRVYRYAGAQS